MTGSGDSRTDLEILIPIKFLDLPQDESIVLQIVADYECSAKIAVRTAMRSHNYKSSSDGGSGPSTLGIRQSTANTSNPQSSTMQAIKLQRKYPEVSQDEMFDLINRFKCVHHAKFYSGGSFRS